MVDVEFRITELSTRLGDVHLDFLGTPGFRGTELGEQVHGEAIQTDLPHVVVEAAGLLKHGILGPGSNRDLVDLLVDIDEAGLLNAPAHARDHVHGTPRPLGRRVDGAAPDVEDVVLGQAVVVAEDVASALELLEPAAGLKVLVALLVEALPLGVRVGAQTESQVDQIEWLAPGPFLEHVVDFQDAVRGHPVDRWGIQVDTADSGWRRLVRC